MNAAPSNFQNRKVRYSALKSSFMSPVWLMKSILPSVPLNLPGPSSLTPHPLTEFAPPEKYRFSKGSTVLLP